MAQRFYYLYLIISQYEIKIANKKKTMWFTHKHTHTNTKIIKGGIMAFDAMKMLILY